MVKTLGRPYGMMIHARRKDIRVVRGSGYSSLRTSMPAAME